MAKLVRGDTNQGREYWFVGTQTKAEKKEKRKLVRGDTNQGGVWGHEPRRSGGHEPRGTQTKAVYVEQKM